MEISGNYNNYYSQLKTQANSGSALENGRKGMQNAQEILNQSAQNIAEGSGQLEKDMTNQIVAETTMGANVQTVQTAEEMLEELMNMRR